jgi:hypothetical protein
MNQKGKKKLNLITQVYGKNTFDKLRNFDCAIIGVEVETDKLIYSVKECIKILKIKMPDDEAIDHFYSEIYSDQKYFGKVIFCEDYLIKKSNI